jgi:Flp pilus assembly pilin Flp
MAFFQARRTLLGGLSNLLRDESGVTAFEYALIAALTLAGTNLSNTFSYVATKL